MCRARFQVFILLTLNNIALCQCKCPQITFKNFVGVEVCNAVCFYQSVQGCIEPESFLEDVHTLSIYNSKTEVFRRGAIQNMKKLRYISLLRTVHIKKLYPGCFLNLPSIEYIDFSFNEIQEILWGVFNNSTIRYLDFSWNEIESIEDEAFSNMPNLKTLIWYRNKLNTFKKDWFTNSQSLEILTLSYNQIKDISPGSFDMFPNLTHLDLSFNKINTLGTSLFSGTAHLHKLDLTSNQLISIEPDVFPNTLHVENLIIPVNKLSSLPTQLLSNGHVRKLRLHPNPWKCPCLDEILKWIHQNNATTESFYEDHRLIFNGDYPQCVVFSKDPGKCVINYDQKLVDDQQDFFQVVNYSEVIREKPTSARPNFNVLHIATLPPGLD